VTLRDTTAPSNSAASKEPVNGLLGLHAHRGVDASLLPMPPTPGEIAYATAELRDLRADVDRLRAERDKLLDVQRRVMELLGTTKPEKLIHDLRNLLNERELYRALADLDSQPG
jgi:hypothetical protein